MSTKEVAMKEEGYIEFNDKSYKFNENEPPPDLLIRSVDMLDVFNKFSNFIKQREETANELDKFIIDMGSNITKEKVKKIETLQDKKTSLAKAAGMFMTHGVTTINEYFDFFIDTEEEFSMLQKMEIVHQCIMNNKYTHKYASKAE